MLNRSFIVVLVIALIGCEAVPAARPAGSATLAAASDEGTHAMVRTELVFGLTREDGTAVDEDAWQEFIDKAIAVSFPAGFTVIDSMGRWRGTEGKVIGERSKVVLIFHDGSTDTLRKIDDLRRAYRQQFGPQAVIRGSSNAWVAF